MGRRREAELYEDEYQEEERTRAALSSRPPVASVPSYDDQFEDRTRSARESQLALEGLARSGPQPRAQRRSYVDAEELLETPHRPSFVAASERRSRVERPAPPPPPPTPRPGSRHSYVASSERADFASSLPDAEEITSHRDPRQSSHPVSQRPARRPSQHPSQHPVQAEREQPLDYKALKSFLFDDVPANSPEAAAMSPEDRSVSMQTPIASLSRMTNKSFRPAMHSIPPSMREPRPEVAPLAKISHHAFRPQMHAQLPGTVAPVTNMSAPDVAKMGHMPTTPVPVQAFNPMRTQPSSVAPSARASHIAFRPPMMTGPMLPPAMPQPMPHAPIGNDSYGDTSWIVPTPTYPSNAAIRETGVFKLTPSFVAAAVTAFAALAVMIGAILFMRTEEAQPAPGPVAAATAPTPVVEAPVAPPVVKAEAPASPPVVAPAAPVASAKKKKVVVAPKPAETAEEEATAPPPSSKKKAAEKSDKAEKSEKPAKPVDKNLERMLADLGEQQLKNSDK